MITSQTETIEELEQEVKEVLPFVRCDFSEVEIVTVYAGLQRYHQALAQADDLAQSQRVIDLMIRLRPSVVEGAKRLKGETS